MIYYKKTASSEPSTLDELYSALQQLTTIWSKLTKDEQAQAAGISEEYCAADERTIELNNFCTTCVKVKLGASYKDCLTTTELKNIYRAEKDKKTFNEIDYNDIKKHLTKNGCIWGKKTHGKRHIANLVPA